MKEKGMDALMDYSDLEFDNEDLLPKKFKFPDMKKYSSTEDPLFASETICHLYENN